MGNNNHHQQHHPPGAPPGWRPPMHFNQNHSHPMGGSMSMPGMHYPPHLPPPHMNGQMHTRSHSPAPPFGQNGHPLPLSGQHTGTMGIPHGHIGASPLAGSLSGGGDPIVRAGSSASIAHAILSPHSLQLALPRVPSPALPAGLGSRPASSQGHHSISPNGSSAPLPPQAGPPFGRASFSAHPGDVPFPPRHSVDHGHVPHLEGLGHKGSGLGPPDNLHDRVVFVQNVSCTDPHRQVRADQ